MYFLEQNDEKLAIQMSNFASKIPDYATTFGFMAEEVESMQADAAAFSWIIINLKKIETFKKNWVTFKNIHKKGEANITSNFAPNAPVLDVAPADVAPGIVLRFTIAAKRVKAHQNYTTAIGNNLGIEGGSARKTNTDDAKPVLKAVFRGGKVHLKWKKSLFTGIIIEKDSGEGFVVLDKDYSPAFVDNSPMPPRGSSAFWQYRASYLMGDEKVGLLSDIVSITVAG